MEITEENSFSKVFSPDHYRKYCARSSVGINLHDLVYFAAAVLIYVNWQARIGQKVTILSFETIKLTKKWKVLHIKKN